MKKGRDYHRRGTPDFPVAFYQRMAHSKLGISQFHPELELVMIVRGTATMELQNTVRSFAPGEIVIIPPNQIHGWRNTSKDAQMRWLIIDPLALSMHAEHFFQKSFVQPLLEGRLEMPSLLKPDHPAYESVVRQLKRLEQVIIYSENYKSYRYSAVLQICATLLPFCRIRETGADKQLPTNEMTKRCICYIRENYAKKLKLADIAFGCHVHPNYLCNVFHRQTGETVMRYLNRMRVEAAAKLLMDPKISVGEIVEMVGFSSEDAFRENFRRYIGCTPREYRKAQKVPSPNVVAL